MTTATTSTEDLLLDEVLSGVYWEVANRQMFNYPLLTTTRPTGKGRERLLTYSELDTLPEVNETDNSPEDKPDEQYTKDFVPTEFKQKVPVSRKLRDDLEWPYMMQIPRALGRATMRTMDAAVGNMWIDVPTGATYTTADGLSIANNAHTTKSSGTTWDNLLANSLTVDGVRATRQAFRDFTDSRNNPMDLNLTHILVPPDLEEPALEIARSTDRPDSANRTANVYLGNVDVIVWNRLTSATQWFGIDMEVLKENAILMLRVAPEFTTFGNPDSDVYYTKAYMRFALNMVDWRGVVANTP